MQRRMMISSYSRTKPWLLMCRFLGRADHRAERPGAILVATLLCLSSLLVPAWGEFEPPCHSSPDATLVLKWDSQGKLAIEEGVPPNTKVTTHEAGYPERFAVSANKDVIAVLGRARRSRDGKQRDSV